MSEAPLRVPVYLAHILQAVERIQRYTGGMDEAGFSRSEITQDAVIRNLEVIGEASRNIARSDPEFAVMHPGLPLSFAYEMRNVHAHGYFKVDLGIVWKTIEADLPELRLQVQAIVEEMANERKDVAGS